MSFSRKVTLNSKEIAQLSADLKQIQIRDESSNLPAAKAALAEHYEGLSYRPQSTLTKEQFMIDFAWFAGRHCDEPLDRVASPTIANGLIDRLQPAFDAIAAAKSSDLPLK